MSEYAAKKFQTRHPLKAGREKKVNRCLDAALLHRDLRLSISLKRVSATPGAPLNKVCKERDYHVYAFKRDWRD
jgi:hypothetical protein